MKETEKKTEKKTAKRPVAEAKAYQSGRESGYREGRKQGLIDGREVGQKEGYKKGRGVGIKEGFADGDRYGRNEGFQEGKDRTYPIAYQAGHAKGILDIVGTVEDQLAEVSAYKDVDEWKGKGTIPAWWIAVLMTHYHSSVIKPEEIEPERIERQE